jgi:hypothetical protein
LLILLGATGGCAGGEDGGTGGGGGDPLSEQSSYRLRCTIDPLVLEFPIELVYELDSPYRTGESVELTLSATVTFTEQVATALIDAGIGKVDIISMDIAAWIEGAIPPSIEASFGAAPINDFDLEVDTDDDGIAGPHRIELDTQTIATEALEGAAEVELGLELDRVSLVLGDFEVPMDCLSPTLVGFSARFPIEPAG